MLWAPQDTRAARLDGYEVIEKSYGHLAPNTGEVNKVMR
jgi:hypothetical protein